MRIPARLSDRLRIHPRRGRAGEPRPLRDAEAEMQFVSRLTPYGYGEAAF